MPEHLCDSPDARSANGPRPADEWTVASPVNRAVPEILIHKHKNKDEVVSYVLGRVS